MKANYERSIAAAEMYDAGGTTFASVGAHFRVSAAQARVLVVQGRRRKAEMAEHNKAVAAGLTDDTPLENLALPVRAANTFAWLGLTTVGQVRAMSDQEILRLPNMGWKSLREVRELTGYALPERIEDLKQQKAKLEARLREIDAELASLGGGK